MRDKNDAFTLLEVIIVIVIISVVTAFGFPNYRKAIQKADEGVIITNLRVIRTAVDMYVANGDALGNWGTLSTINSGLGLSIIDRKATYACQPGGGLTNGCTATHPAGWAIQFHDEHSNRLLHCSAGTCPTCPAQPGDCG